MLTFKIRNTLDVKFEYFFQSRKRIWNCTQNSDCFVQASPCFEWAMRSFKGDYSHYTDVTMSPMSSQITSLGIVYSTVYSGADQRKHQSSASLAFVRRIHRGPVNSPHKRPVTRKMFPFDDVIMWYMKTVMWSHPIWWADPLDFTFEQFTSKSQFSISFFFFFLIWVFKIINMLRPEQNGRQFADYIFRCIFYEEMCCIFKLSFKWILFLRVTINQRWVS